MKIKKKKKDWSLQLSFDETFLHIELNSGKIAECISSSQFIQSEFV